MSQTEADRKPDTGEELKGELRETCMNTGCRPYVGFGQARRTFSLRSVAGSKVVAQYENVKRAPPAIAVELA